MMTSIFISYRHKDTGGHAGRIFDRLRQWFPKEELFFDVDSVGMGDDFPEEIDQAIRAAKAVLVVIGPEWLDVLNRRAEEPGVDFVRREVAIAIQRRVAVEIELFPILVGGGQMPDSENLCTELRDEIGKLFDYEAHTFQENQADWDNQFERLRKRLAQVDGVPAPKNQSSFTGDSLNFDFKGVAPTLRPTSLDVPAVERAFGTVSKELLNWPQEIDGHWIERSELAQLHELTKRNESTVTVLLGGPGEGKSAIFARLGEELSGEGAVLLAIKADRLPRNAATLGDLDDWIGCGVPVTEALRELANHRRIVVLIDQLDALADLMDQHSERLSALIRLVNAVRDLPNLHVVVSCREFEFSSDVRFNSLNAEKVSLARLSWNQIEHLPAARGLKTGGWSEGVRDVLRTPQHMAIFLDHLSGEENEPLFANYQGLLTRIVKERVEKVHGRRTVDAAERIATDMALEEELWIGRHRFEREFGDELQRLEEAGFLVRSDNGLSIAFRHQTLFDFLRARSFLREGHSLAEYIVERKQQSLFVRPILWSALNYLRASDRAVYRKQFRQLWIRNDLRPHLRYLLIDFLGQITEPEDQEAQRLFSKLADRTLRARILRAIAGSPAWFTRVESRLPTFMSAQPEEAWEVASILAKAAAFEPGQVLRLVDLYWVEDERYLPCALTVMRDFTFWDESIIHVVSRLADHVPADRFSIQEIANQISKSRPDLAPKVIVRYLRAETDKLGADTETSSSRLAPGASVAGQIDNSANWHGIDELATKAPRAFVEEIWPWLVDLFERLGREEDPFLHQYRGHNGLAFRRETNDRQPLQKAIEVAICGFAETEVEDFLNFVDKNKNTDLNVLHHLLALGLERFGRQYPTTVLEYLLGDLRRFAIGDMNNVHRDSQALISAVVPSLESNQALCLERAITAWPWYREVPKGEDAASRLQRRKWTREHRLRLLSAFPLDRLSPSGKRHLREEERALPGAPTEDIPVVKPRRVGSPMSAEQMERATDDQIFALFEELTDDTGWDHPSRRTDFVGGSIQASREFASFAKNAPDRALNLIRRFRAGTMENPAGTALAELAKGSAPPETLVACIHELDERGFASEHFRTDAARCLGELAHRFGGLDDAACGLLEKWITHWRPETSAEGTDDQTVFLRPPITSAEPEEKDQTSLLWDQGPPRGLPQGNYPFLDALTHGYLCREPQEVNNWLAVLERHLERDENPAVWREVAEDLQRLVQADRGRAIRFLESFFSSCPEVLHTVTGVSLIGHILSWFPDRLLERIMDNWISASWEDGPQAVGEIMALKLCLNPDDPDTRKRIERIVVGDDFDPSVIDGLRLGVAHTLAATWAKPALRALTTPFLVRFVSMEGLAVERALSAIFSRDDTFPADDHTSNFLEALLEHPAILVGGGHFLIKGLKGLLRDGWNSTLVYKVTNALILEIGTALGDVRTAGVAHAGDLADIALTLHRIPETRESGLDLFERLMDIRSFGLAERVAMIDRPAFQ